VWCTTERSLRGLNEKRDKIWLLFSFFALFSFAIFKLTSFFVVLGCLSGDGN
jgi:hypothetical protein